MKRNVALLVAAMALSGSNLALAAKVYKWADQNGKITYSDKPHGGAVAVHVSTAPTGVIAPKQKGTSVTSAHAQDDSQDRYDRLVIVSPSNEQIIDRSGLAVAVTLEPSLKTERGHEVRLIVDGRPIEKAYIGGDGIFVDTDRGSHTLQAQVVDRAGTPLINSDVVTFHVHLQSRLGVAGPNLYPPVYPAQPYPQSYKPDYPPQPYPPQGKSKRIGN